MSSTWHWLYEFALRRYLKRQSIKRGSARVLILCLAYMRDWAYAHKLDFDAAVVASGRSSRIAENHKEERDDQ